MVDSSHYGLPYYEGKTCNYGSYGGYASKRMGLTRFAVFRKSYQMIRKYKKRGKALDIGCAYGYLANFLSIRGFETEGCDISDFALGMANKMFPHIRTFQADMDNGVVLPLEKYDLITSFEMLEHCKNVDRIARNVSSSLKSGGLFLISVPDSDIVPPENQGDDSHVTFLNTSGWIDMFSKHGLECVESTFFPKILLRIKPYWGTNLILFRKP